MDLLEDLKISILNSNFVMIYIIHRTLVLLKNQLNYLKGSILECFYKKHNIIFFFKKINFSQQLMMESSNLEE